VLRTKATDVRYSGNSRFPVHPDVERAKAELLEAFIAGAEDYGLKVLRLQYLLARCHPEKDRPPAQRILTDNHKVKRILTDTHKAKLSASWAAKRARRAVAFGTRPS
jgi:hypothetical protein